MPSTRLASNIAFGRKTPKQLPNLILSLEAAFLRNSLIINDSQHPDSNRGPTDYKSAVRLERNGNASKCSRWRNSPLKPMLSATRNFEMRHRSICLPDFRQYSAKGYLARFGKALTFVGAVHCPFVIETSSGQFSRLD